MPYCTHWWSLSRQIGLLGDALTYGRCLAMSFSLHHCIHLVFMDWFSICPLLCGLSLFLSIVSHFTFQLPLWHGIKALIMLFGRLWPWSLVACLGDTLIRGIFLLWGGCFLDLRAWCRYWLYLGNWDYLLMNFGELMKSKCLYPQGYYLEIVVPFYNCLADTWWIYLVYLYRLIMFFSALGQV